MHLTRLLSLSLLAGPFALAHDPITTPLTWSKEISRLLQHRCLGCHQPGGKAPFSLMTYDEARPWAVAIREEVSNRTMPPWNAVKGFGSFRGEMALTREEILTITDWVNGGAPEGDPKLAASVLPHLYHPEQAPIGAVESAAGPFTHPVRLLGLRITAMPTGADARLYLQQPDGARLPLLWIHHFNPAAPRVYLLAAPLAVPAGARIVIAQPVVQRARILALSERISAAPKAPSGPSPSRGPARSPIGE
ncbi:hypothetical protein [uncultured Paludibaculum sp.]|uniref:hypothetical protein n=1 Tax=uncultured Paludibaculum sp. TaxID=1765020 RepID=UPI002AAAD97E|nr:hypothetical protein [uncultured Paludibaculum sp.]